MGVYVACQMAFLVTAEFNQSHLGMCIMKMNQISKLAAAVALAAASMSASAMIIDFKSSDWSGANAQGSFSFGGVTLTACLTSTLPGCSQTLGYPRLSWSSGSGIGIKSTVADPNADEVGRLILTEVLKVTFDDPTAVWGFTLKKFRTGEAVTGDEKFSVSTDNVTYTSFTANGTDPFAASYYAPGVSTLYFKPVARGSEASLDTLHVPVPATLPLIGLGLAAFAGLSRRRQLV